MSNNLISIKEIKVIKYLKLNSSELKFEDILIDNNVINWFIESINMWLTSLVLVKSSHVKFISKASSLLKIEGLSNVNVTCEKGSS